LNTDLRSIFEIGINLIQFLRSSTDLQNKYRSKSNLKFLKIRLIGLKLIPIWRKIKRSG